MRRRTALALLLATSIPAIAACSGGAPASSSARPDSVTQRQVDSAIGESRLPGARGVKGALEASDAAARRAAVLDSLQREY